MAGSTKTEFPSNVYTEQGQKEPRRSSAGQSEEQNRPYIIAPGLDQFYEFVYQYGLLLLLFALVGFSFWLIWAVDFSGGM